MDSYEALVKRANEIAPHPGKAPTTFNIFGLRFGEPARLEWENNLALHNQAKQRLIEEEIKKISDPLYNATLAHLSMIGGKPVEYYATPSQYTENKELVPSVVPHFDLTNPEPSIRQIGGSYNLVEHPDKVIWRRRHDDEDMAGLIRLTLDDFNRLLAPTHGPVDANGREELLAYMSTEMDPWPFVSVEPYRYDTRMQFAERPGGPLEITTRTVNPNAPLDPTQQALGRAMLEREGKWSPQHAMNPWEMLAREWGPEAAAKLFADQVRATIDQKNASTKAAISKTDVDAARLKYFLSRANLAEAEREQMLRLIDERERLLTAQAALDEQRARGASAGTDIAQERLNFEKNKFATTMYYLIGATDLPDEVRDAVFHDLLNMLGVEVSGYIKGGPLENLLKSLLGIGVNVGKGESEFKSKTQPQAKPQEQPVQSGKGKKERPDLSKLPPGPIGARKRDKVTGDEIVMTEDGWKWLDEWTPKKK
jgi:hypothetical protein